MTFEEYNRAISDINKQFDIISERTEGQAWLGTANFSNQDFVTLMNLQAHLIKRSSELTERMMK